MKTASHAASFLSFRSRHDRNKRAPEVTTENEGWRTSPPDEREIHIWWIDLDDAARGAETDLRLLSADESLRAGRYHGPVLRRRFIAGRAALRRILAAYSEADPAGLRFRYDPSGKPHLDNAPFSDITFNASHSESTMLVAVGQMAAIGIDVECIRTDTGSAGLIETFFAEREQQILRSVPQPERPSAFFTIWTRKEAVTKAMGDGIAAPLRDIDVVPAAGASDPPETWRYPSRAGRWQVYSIDHFPGFACALAVSVRIERLRVIRYAAPLSGGN